MNGRQAFALTHPMNSADPVGTQIEQYRTVVPQPDGNLLVSALAIDR